MAGWREGGCPALAVEAGDLAHAAPNSCWGLVILTNIQSGTGDTCWALVLLTLEEEEQEEEEEELLTLVTRGLPPREYVVFFCFLCVCVGSGAAVATHTSTVQHHVHHVLVLL